MHDEYVASLVKEFGEAKRNRILEVYTEVKGRLEVGAAESLCTNIPLLAYIRMSQIVFLMISFCFVKYRSFCYFCSYFFLDCIFQLLL